MTINRLATQAERRRHARRADGPKDREELLEALGTARYDTPTITIT